MSEQTYTRIVQIIVLLLFVLGLIYADPFPPAYGQALAKRDDRHVSNGKPCVLLKNGSLSSFANGIRALNGGAFHAGMGDTVLVKRHDHDTRRNAHQNT